MNGFKLKSPRLPMHAPQTLIHGRFSRMLVLVGITLGMVVSMVVADQDLAREKRPGHWNSDAELTDVFFLDADRGWAVGAQGVILRTTDGGKRWIEISQIKQLGPSTLSLEQKIRAMRSGARTQSTGVANDRSTDHPVRCRFESVHFVDAHHGWVAGGYDVPYVDRSRAVIMKTNDGGVTWNELDGLVIPRIHRIRFTDPNHGWAIGEAGNLFGTGIYHTSNGGRSWSSQSQEKTTGWADAAPTKAGFATISHDGRLGTFHADRYEPSVVLGPEPRSISRIQMVNPNEGWAVGDAGTLLKTTNGGLSWSRSLTPTNGPTIGPTIGPTNGPTNATQVKQFDLTALAITEQTIWFAGDPGTYLFSMNRTTGETTALQTPLHSRINQIHFSDDQHGWAVGTFGMVIATRDGGKHWEIQRGENNRVAILCVAPDFESHPFEVLAKYAIEENRLCASMLLTGSDREHQAALQSTERLGGLSSILITRTREAGAQIDDDPNRALEKMVRVIRSLRPSVIVFETRNTRSSSTYSRSTPTATLQKAIQMAADSSAFPRQISDAGLRVWQVTRLAIRDPSGSVELNPMRLLPRAGALIEDLTAISRAGVGKSTISRERPSYRVSHFTSYRHMSGGDLLSGLDLQSGIPSRTSDNAIERNLLMIQEIAAKHKRFEQFEAFESNNARDLAVWNQQVLSFASKLDDSIAGIWLTQLAERYLESGKTELAANANHLLVTRWPDHALTPAATTWLVQYYASDEFGQIEFMQRERYAELTQSIPQAKQIQTESSFSLTPRPIDVDGVRRLVWLPTHAPEETESTDENIALAQSTEMIVATRPEFFDQRLRLAGRYLSQLQQRDPDLTAGPQYRLFKSQITRRVNRLKMNEAPFNNLAHDRDTSENGIAIAARRELWLNKKTNSSDPTRNTISMTCLFTDSRPTLDGKLDESFWQSAIQREQSVRHTANPIESSANDQQQSRSDIAVLAYDNDYLYAGFTCQKIPGQFYDARKQPRPRDPDLAGRDRIELNLDIDRDYRSSFRFVVDHRGWVRESCGGSQGWNPDWYVAQSETETTWTVEFAIPLNQLVPNSIEPRATWAVQIARRSFGDRNLWPNSSPNQAPVPTGLRAGFVSQPQRFELIRFEGQSTPTPPTESDSALTQPLKPVG